MCQLSVSFLTVGTSLWKFAQWVFIFWIAHAHFPNAMGKNLAYVVPVLLFVCVSCMSMSCCLSRLFLICSKCLLRLEVQTQAFMQEWCCCVMQLWAGTLLWRIAGCSCENLGLLQHAWPCNRTRHIFYVTLSFFCWLIMKSIKDWYLPSFSEYWKWNWDELWYCSHFSIFFLTSFEQTTCAD